MLCFIPPFSPSLCNSCSTLRKRYKSRYRCLYAVIFITAGHTGVVSGAKLKCELFTSWNVNTVVWVNRHSCTITSHCYTADIIKGEATNGPPFENRSKAATLYSYITLDFFFHPHHHQEHHPPLLSQTGTTGLIQTRLL